MPTTLLRNSGKHSLSEYHGLLYAVLEQVEHMVDCLTDNQQEVEVLDFLETFGCYGYPGSRVGDFRIGPKISSGSMPTSQHDGVVIIPCFSDDILPVKHKKEGFIYQGSSLYSDHAIILYDVDRWSLAELALTLLHEGRHMRHRLGFKLAGLGLLDPDDNAHETSTWIFMINVLSAWGGDVWKAAVQQEICWLQQQALDIPGHDRFVWASSGYNWPEIDQVFGQTSHEDIQKARQQLVSLHANVAYWPARQPLLSAEQTCHSIVKHLYGL